MINIGQVINERKCVEWDKGKAKKKKLMKDIINDYLPFIIIKTFFW